MQFGISYYPELVHPDQWSRDLDNMAELGLEVLRMLDFAWAALEPREGEYDWDWLDKFMAMADERGMKTLLCTPTATPPAWLASQYPQIMLELRSGQRRPFGSRRDIDICSPIYRDYCAEIAQRMGERYGDHATIIGWQIDNEICGPEKAPPESHSPEATWRFRRWLREKYQTVDAVNKAWGLTFWNQAFSDWGEIITPRHDRVSRGWVIDHGEFYSDMVIEFAKVQYDVLRPIINRDQWINHNSTAMLDRGIDHAKLGQTLDNAGWDAYYNAANAGHGHQEDFTALVCDWLRSATGKPIKIMETGLGGRDCTPEYMDLLRRHGADLILFWHYRSHRGNVESEGSAVTDYNGEPLPARVDALKRVMEWNRNRPPQTVSIERQDAALVYSLGDARNDLHLDPYNRTPRPDYLDSVVHAYGPARAALGCMDVVNVGESVDGYKLVIVPGIRQMDHADAEPLIRFVKAGGTLIITAKAALCNRTAIFHEQPGSPLEEVTGVVCRTNQRLGPGAQVKFVDGPTCEVHTQIDRMDTWRGEVLAHFVGGELDGHPAVLHRPVGKGHVFYSAAGGMDIMANILPTALATAGLQHRTHEDTTQTRLD